jgi:hypothetical protein
MVYAGVLPIMFHPKSNAPLVLVNSVQLPSMCGQLYHECDTFGGDSAQFPSPQQCAAHWFFKGVGTHAVIAMLDVVDEPSFVGALLANKHMATIETEHVILYVVQMQYAPMLLPDSTVCPKLNRTAVTRVYSHKNITGSGRCHAISLMDTRTGKPRSGFRFVPIACPSVQSMTIPQILSADLIGKRRPFMHSGSFVLVSSILHEAIENLQLVINKPAS